MSTITETATTQIETEYVYFHYDGEWGHKREVLKGDRAKKTFTSLPIVDLGDLSSENLENRRRVAKEMVDACENTGFFYIKNHGIDQSLIDRTLESNRKYFEKPVDVKMREHIYKSRNLRGYEPMHGAILDATKPAGGKQTTPVILGWSLV